MQKAKYVVFSRSKQGYYFHTFNLARQRHFSETENRPSVFMRGLPSADNAHIPTGE